MNTVLTRAPRKVLLGASVPVLAVLGLGAGWAMSADAADPVAEMTASPNPLTFDDTPVGSTMDALVTLRSSGTAAVDVADVVNTGRDRAQFAILSETCTGAVLAPGDKCGVTVRFAPKVAGTLVSNLRFDSTNACARYVNMAGSADAPAGSSARAGDRAAAPADEAAAAPCEVVSGPMVTVTTPAQTVSTPRQTVTSPAATVTAPASTVVTPGAVVTVPAPATTVLQTTAPSVAPTIVPASVAGVAATSPKVCRSRRSITLNVKPRTGTTLAKVSVRVNGRLVRVFRKPSSGRIAAKLTLQGLPRTRVEVVLRSVTTDGGVAKRTQHFVTCVPKG